MTDTVDTLVVGGGPAGLTAAYQLAKEGGSPLVLERQPLVGGISRTETYKGFWFDIGGHRFFTKVSEVDALWHEILGDDLIRRDRLSRIYYGGKFYAYPLAFGSTLRNLGIVESSRIVASYLRTKTLSPYPEENNLEEWVSNRFGRRLYRTFFQTYTEKVWGIPCTEIQADWAAQRIKGLSLRGALQHAILGDSEETSLIHAFDYPRLGPGMLWERCAERVEALGGQVELETEVVRLGHADGVVNRVVARGPEGERTLVPEYVINSMPLKHLIQRMEPAAPPEVLEAAESLKYRDFLVVVLIVDRAELFPDNWIYIHSPDVVVGRIQNFKNWSPEMVPDARFTALGMEYFCNVGDDVWAMDDEALVEFAARELDEIGLATRAEVTDGTVIRQTAAYPVYDGAYRDHLDVVRDWLAGFENLQTVGRAGMHRYNNQDHSMLTAMLAVRRQQGELEHDLWNVNVERSYHEDFQIDESLGG